MSRMKYSKEITRPGRMDKSMKASLASSKPNSQFPGFTSSDNSELSSSTKDSSPEHDGHSRKPNHSDSSCYSTCFTGPCDHVDKCLSEQLFSPESQGNSRFIENQAMKISNPEVARIQQEIKKLAKNKRKTLRIIRQLKHQMNSEEQVMNMKQKGKLGGNTLNTTDSDVEKPGKMCFEIDSHSCSSQKQSLSDPLMDTELSRKVACSESASTSAANSFDFEKEIQTVKTYVHTDGLKVCTSVTTKESTRIHEKDCMNRLINNSSTSSRRSCEFVEKEENLSNSSKAHESQLLSTSRHNPIKRNRRKRYQADSDETLNSRSIDDNCYQKRSNFHNLNLNSHSHTLAQNESASDGATCNFGTDTSVGCWDVSGKSSISNPSCNYDMLYQSDCVSTPSSSYDADTTDRTLSSSEEAQHHEKPLMEEIIDSSSDSINTFLTNQSTHKLSQAVAIKHSAEDKLVESCRKKYNHKMIESGNNACMFGMSGSSWNPNVSLHSPSREDCGEFPDILESLPSSPIYKSYSQSSCMASRKGKEIGIAVSFSSGDIPRMIEEPCNTTRAIRRRLNLLSIIKSVQDLEIGKSRKKLTPVNKAEEIYAASKRTLESTPSTGSLETGKSITGKHQATDISSSINTCMKKVQDIGSTHEAGNTLNIARGSDLWNRSCAAAERTKSKFMPKHGRSQCASRKTTKNIISSYLDHPEDNAKEVVYEVAAAKTPDKTTVEITESSERIHRDLRTNTDRVKTRHHQLRNIFKRKPTKK